MIKINVKTCQVYKDDYGNFWATDGKVYTETRDWNYDDDVYTDSVILLVQIDGNMYNFCRPGCMEEFERVSMTPEQIMEMRNQYNRRWGFKEQTSL